MIKFPLSREDFLQTNRRIQQGLLATMAHGTRKESKSLPVQETLDKPYQFPSPERGNQRRPASSPLLPGRVSEDQPAWVVNAHLVLHKIIETVRNIPLATVFSFIFAAAMGILKIFSIPKDKTRKRDELKEKVEEIKYAKPKEIEHHKWKLKEQLFFSRFIKTIVSFILDKL